MNRSYPGSSDSNVSTGFVYFKTRPDDPNQGHQNESDTGDFLAFSDSPQVCHKNNPFKPNYSSSPYRNSHRGSPRNFYHNRSSKWKRYSSGESSSYNRSSKSYSFDEHDRSHNKSKLNENDITKYLHPSFMEDPWAPLMEQLKNKKQSYCQEVSESNHGEA